MESVKNIPVKLAEKIPGYGLFLDNQVLTAKQLNDTILYLEQQHRLTRTRAVGVGVVCGLELRFVPEEGIIEITKGCAITTDGDLLCLEQNTTYTQFKRFEDKQANPSYWYVEGESEIYELFQADATETGLEGLGNFPSTAGLLEDKVAVLYLESFLEKPDDCVEGDCDTLGMIQHQNLKVLLVGKEQPLMFPQLECISYALPRLAVRRPDFSVRTNTRALFLEVYRTAVQATLTERFFAALAQSYEKFAHLLIGEFPQDPTGAWIDRLKKLDVEIVENLHAPQYAWGFLRDLIDAYHEFADAVEDICLACCPNPSLFAKHVMLGELTLENEFKPYEFRHHFRETSALNKGDKRLRLVQRLYRRLDLLIQNFGAPEASSGVRITPSCAAKHKLAQRAIPYYYQMKSPNGRFLHDFWDAVKGARGQGNQSHGYHAQGSNGYGIGSANEPLVYDLENYDFFRIEGHIGEKYEVVEKNLQTLLKKHRLPFKIESIQLDEDKVDEEQRPIRPKKKFWFRELDLVHKVYQLELKDKLSMVSGFNNKLKERVDNSDVNLVDFQDDTALPTFDLKVATSDDTKEINDKISLVNLELSKPSREFNFTTFKQNYSDALNRTGVFNGKLRRAVNPTAFTPLESLTHSVKPNILSYLDKWRIKREEKAIDQFLFANFLEKTGASHLAGVPRGGTFILLYEAETEQVVGDFYLSYPYQPVLEEEPEEEVVETPVVTDPPVKDWFDLNDILIRPSVTPFGVKDSIDKVDGKIGTLDLSIDDKLNLKIDGLKGEIKSDPDTILGIENFKDKVADIDFWNRAGSEGLFGAAVSSSKTDFTPADGLSGSNKVFVAGLGEMTERANILAAKDELTAKEQQELNLLKDNIDRQVSSIVDLVGSQDQDINVFSEDAKLIKAVQDTIVSLDNSVQLTTSHDTLAQLKGDGTKPNLIGAFGR